MAVSKKVLLPTNYYISKKIQKMLILLRYKHTEIFSVRGAPKNFFTWAPQGEATPLFVFDVKFTVLNI